MDLDLDECACYKLLKYLRVLTVSTPLDFAEEKEQEKTTRQEIPPASVRPDERLAIVKAALSLPTFIVKPIKEEVDELGKSQSRARQAVSGEAILHASLEFRPCS
jgi:hypothetical protein